MADHVTDAVSSGGKGGHYAEYTVDAGSYDWVVDFERFNKNAGMLGYFVNDGVSWIKLFDTRTDFPGSENFNRASFTIGNSFTFNGVDYDGDPVVIDHPEDAFVLFVVPTVTPQPNTQFSWDYSVSITPANDGPHAVNDVIKYDWGEKGAKSFDVVANDTDPEGNLARNTVEITRQPKWGTLTIQDGVVTYTPNQPFNEPTNLREPRSDSFQYTVRDAGNEISNPATVRITVGDCPEPLPLIVTGGDITKVSDELCRVDGEFYVGREDGESNLLVVRNGSGLIYDDKLILHGDIYAGAGNRLLASQATVTLRAPSAEARGGDFDSSGPIKLAGLDFDVSRLKLEPNAVELGGKLKLSQAFDAISLDLDEIRSPLRIVSGELSSGLIDPAAITFANFGRAWKTVVEKFSLSYTPETDALRMNGLFNIEQQFFSAPMGKDVMRGVKLDLLTSGRFLEIKEGELAGNASFDIAANLAFGKTIQLSKITGSLKFEHDAIREISLGGKLKVGPITWGGELGVLNIDPPGSPASLDNLKLDKIKLSIESEKGVMIAGGPIPPHVLYGVGGAIEAKGLAALLFADTPPPDAQLGLGGSLTFAFITPTKIKQELTDDVSRYIGNLVGLTSIDGYLLSLEVGQPSPPPGSPANQSLLALPIGVNAHMELNGAAKLATVSDRLFVVDGQFHLDLTAGKGSVFGHASLLNGLAEGSVTANIDLAGMMSIKGTLAGSLPIPGSLFSASGTIGLYGQIIFDADPSNDYLVAMTKVQIGELTLRGGVKVVLNPNEVSFEFLTPGQVKVLVGSWDVEAGESGLIMQMQWTESQFGADVPIMVTYRPVGGELIEIFEEDFAAYGITVVQEMSGDLVKTIVVENPAEGRWDIVPLDEGALGDITYTGFSTDAEPVFSLLSTRDVDPGTIRHTIIFDNEGEALDVEFFWDDNDDGADGNHFETRFIETGLNSISFTTPGGAPQGPFWVYGNAYEDFSPVMPPVMLDATPAGNEGTVFRTEVTIGGTEGVVLHFFIDEDGDGVGGTEYGSGGLYPPGTYEIDIFLPEWAPPTFFLYATIDDTGEFAVSPIEVTPEPAFLTEEFTINYAVTDEQPVKLTWYWDTDGDSEGGTAFAVQEDVAAGQHAFAFNAPPGVSGDFWVYAEIDDGFYTPLTTAATAFHADSVTVGADLVVSSDIGESVDPGWVVWTVTIRNDGDTEARDIVLEEEVGLGALHFESASTGVTVEQIYETPEDEDPEDEEEPEPVLDPSRLRIVFDDPLAAGEERTVTFTTITNVGEGGRTLPGETTLLLRHNVSASNENDYADNVVLEEALLNDNAPVPYEPGSPDTPDVSIEHVDRGLHGSERWVDIVITNRGPVASQTFEVLTTLLNPESGAQPGYINPLPNESFNEGWRIDGVFTGDLDGNPLTRLIRVLEPLESGESIVVPIRLGNAAEGVARVETKILGGLDDFDPTNDADIYTATGMVNEPQVSYFASHSPFSYRIEQGPPPTPHLLQGHLNVGTTYYSNLQISSSISTLPTFGGHVHVDLEGAATINFNGTLYGGDFDVPLSFLPNGINVPGDTITRLFSLTPTAEGDITIKLSIEGMSRDNTFDIPPHYSWYTAGDDPAAVYVGAVPTQTWTQGEAITLSLPDTFWQTTGGGAVDITILDWWIKGKDLPPGGIAGEDRIDWLTWNPETQTFSGVMNADDVPQWNNYDLVLQVSNQAGGVTETRIDIDIVNINDAPVVQFDYHDRAGYVGVEMNINLAKNVGQIAHDSFNGDLRSSATHFSDPDGWAIVEGQRQVEFLQINYTGYPAFLQNQNNTLVGTPTEADIGVHTVTVTATDRLGATTSQTFDLVIHAVSQPVSDPDPLPQALATQEAAFSYVIPLDAFSDPEGDPLSYAVLDRPAWLAYDAETRTLFGTPGAGDVGTFTLRIVASDGKLGLATRDLELTVADINDTPMAVADYVPNVPATGAPLIGAAGALTDNDVEFDGDDLDASLGTGPRFGTATVGADGSYSYTVGANFRGEDSFTYVIEDADGASSEAPVFLGVGVAQAHGNHTLTGDATDDTLSGGFGDDTLDGRAGDDSLYGGDGNDTVLFGGGGTDSVVLDLQAGTASGVGIGSDIVLEVEHAVGGNGADTISGTAARNRLWGGEGDDRIDGRGDRDTLYGAGGHDRLTGGDDNDTIYGGAGDDTIYGGSGNDLIFGGDGNDRIYAGVGTDQYTGGAGDDVYYGVERFSAGGVIIDNVFDDGGGRDTAYVAESGVSLGSGIEVGIMDFAGDGHLFGNSTDNALYGNAGSNSLDGSSGNDTIYGAGGIDRLFGGSGNDFLYGGAGADSMYGGTGNDLYRIDDVGDVASEQGGGGTEDRAQVYVSGVTIAAGIERVDVKLATGATITAAGATDNSLFGAAGNDRLNGGDGNDRMLGNEGDDILDGGAGNDVLYGGAGIDTMFGGAGDDLYRLEEVGDIVDETGGSGSDWLVAYVSGVTIGEGIERIDVKLATGATITAAGATDNSMFGDAGDDRLNAGDGDDRLLGNGGNDILDGGAGNDLLYGGGGVDTMYGGAGDDIYRLDELGDIADESGGSGFDWAVVYVSGLTVGEGVERIDVKLDTGATVTAAGTTDNTLFGDIGDDWLNAGAGNDRVEGGAGNDVLNGGAGVDRLRGGAGEDVFLYAAGDGNDLILDFSAEDTVDLDGVTFAGQGATANIALLSDGAIITAQAGWNWSAGDFV